MYTVYCHVFPNGKRYIGITRTSLERRWGNGIKYKGCPLVNRAIEKYGWENVKHEILCTIKTKEEAELKEREFIARYQTTDTRLGYNVLPGGNVADNPPTEEMRYKLGSGWRGKHRTVDEKQRISESVKKRFLRPESNGHIGLKATEDTKKKMSESQKKSWESEERRKAAAERLKKRMGDDNYKKKIMDTLAKTRRKSGEWKMPESAKKKLSDQMKGRWIGEKSPTSKPVLQYSKDGVFIKRWENAGEAERAGFGLRSNISKCCRGNPHVKSVCGFVWRFET